ncbi:hypothetical protein RHMOL_Rhmol03G0174800 [Rhododendron molle]|uniref:Uncharacterized protein n=1 Tax=Rhododendron molle TaxID=49168 RepID=A0ACC0PHR6_RHOML|nr:hypothetical protein RHMOL_Rhmol03G0174800 [Rhododendron molle]
MPPYHHWKPHQQHLTTTEALIVSLSLHLHSSNPNPGGSATLAKISTSFDEICNSSEALRPVPSQFIPGFTMMTEENLWSSASTSSVSNAFSHMSIGAQSWLLAEDNGQAILAAIQPSRASEHRRKEVINYLQSLIIQTFGAEVGFDHLQPERESVNPTSRSQRFCFASERERERESLKSVHKGCFQISSGFPCHFQMNVLAALYERKIPYKQISKGLFLKSSPRNEKYGVSLKMEEKSSGTFDLSLEEFPLLPVAKKAMPSKSLQPNKSTVEAPQPQKSSPVSENIEFGFFEPSAICTFFLSSS